MKQKINIRLSLISVLAILITAFCLMAASYEMFQQRVKHDLRIEAQLLKEAGIDRIIESNALHSSADIRITWISRDGTVLYDNDAKAASMNNHMDRPEVWEAFEKGYGESVRESDTMKSMTFYYAVLQEDNTVLRVSTKARSVFSVFLSFTPIVLLIILAISILCVFISHYLTRQLLAPISQLAEDLDHVPGDTVYKELNPFIDRIREQHENILAAAKSRQDFTANVSHELKTPLTAISGYAELIENRMVDEEKQIKFAGDIHKNADRLVVLINDIIRLSELDHAQAGIDFEPLDLYEIAKERMDFLKGNANQKNVRLVLKGESCLVMSNRGLLIELLDNLVQNAIRYNIEDGTVTVCISKEGQSAVMTVTDTGIGIPPKDQPHVFERFYRVDKSRSRETGGTGLGLAIVKHIVQLHEGQIVLKSEPGKGTSIKVTL